ncbi:uncharacterized protein [Typha angustifolia]|uniref:uncharacterized protein n=1 Tax=Typha angustifolia TaxID=59011 RepID=UPI003C2E0500
MVGLWSSSVRGGSPSTPPRFDDLDSFLLDPHPDFDPIKEWLVDFDHAQMSGDDAKGENPNGVDPSGVLGDDCPVSDESGSKRGYLGVQTEVSGLLIDEKMKNVSLVEDLDGGHAYSCLEMIGDKDNAEKAMDNGGGEKEKADECPEGVKGSEIAEDYVVSDPVKVAHESDEESSETESDNSDDDDDSSSQQSSSSSDDEEEEEKDDDDKGDDNDGNDTEKVRVMDEAVDFEEGEIVGSDDDEGNMKGPIKSKHEIEVLPPVPKIDIQLEPHHQTLPVGVILSILGDRVIVEGLEKHNPLNEGSILWITESRIPLGLVDEVFGPVKCPYYVIRYNSDKELPAGISVGTAVSFVMQFANHILNEKELYRKGYDASGDNDEELADEIEFSDDEKEAEYRRSLRQSKRGNDDRQHNRKPFVDRKRTNLKDAGIQKEMVPVMRHPPASLGQSWHGTSNILQVPTNADTYGCSSSAGVGSSCISAPAMVPTVSLPPAMSLAFPLAPAMTPVVPPAAPMGSYLIDQSQQLLRQQQNVVWPTGCPPQLQQSLGIQGGFGTFMMQSQQMGYNNYPQQYQNQSFNFYPNAVPPQQQFLPNTGLAPNSLWLGGPVNPSLGAMPYLPTGQGSFGQVPYGCGNMQAQGISGFPSGQSNGEQPPTQGGGNPPVQFNPGNSSFRGRKPHQRGGRHFFGRGGRSRNG